MSATTHKPTTGSAHIWQGARGFLRALEQSDDYTRNAELLIQHYPNHPPDAFYNSPNINRQKMYAALGGGDGWASRLLGSLDRPHFYSLRAEHLGLEETLMAAEGYYRREVVYKWREAVRAQLVPPLWWRLELGNSVHIHVIASRDAGLMHIRRDGEVIKPIYDPEGLLMYLMKPPEYTVRNLALWLEARKRGRLPRTSGTIGVPNSRIWRGIS